MRRKDREVEKQDEIYGKKNLPVYGVNEKQ